jgi:hypothetical protein
VKDDALREELLAELRVLRRGPGPFGQDRVAESEMLIDFVGRGSVEQSHSTLLDVLDREAEDPEAAGPSDRPTNQGESSRVG